MTKSTSSTSWSRFIPAKGSSIVATGRRSIVSIVPVTICSSTTTNILGWRASSKPSLKMRVEGVSLGEVLALQVPFISVGIFRPVGLASLEALRGLLLRLKSESGALKLPVVGEIFAKREKAGRCQLGRISS
ncbi:protein of unknown function [Hyphomicrobium sp. MC1]|nr:protein of unknown function [Hyphomicrobium sp. MC1]